MMVGRALVQAGVGLALTLIGIGCYEAWHAWSSSRKWEPLNIPVSLDAGQIRTPEFEINAQSKYRIAFIAPSGFGHQPAPSEPAEYQYCLPDLGPSWSLSKHGESFAKGAEQNCDWLGSFDADAGRYVLTVDISRDGSRFNSFHPRLAVFEVGGIQDDAATLDVVAIWGLIVLLALSTAHVFRAALMYRHQKLASLLTACPLTRPQPNLPPWANPATTRTVRIQRPIATTYLLGDRRSYLRYPLTGLSSIALIAWTVFLMAGIGISVLRSLDYRVPVGIPFNIASPVSAPMPQTYEFPVLVQLKLSGPDGGRPDLYLNWRPVSWENFEKSLRKELNSRPPDWPVYLEGDSNMQVMWAVKTADLIRGQQAKVTLLTRPIAAHAK